MPPVRFPVYGLDSSFTGPRWLELFGDPPDGTPTWVTLGHQSADGQSMIQVTTFLRRATGNPRGFRVPTDTQAAERGWPALEDVAGQGTVALIDLTLPVLSLTRPPGFLPALVHHAQAAAKAYGEWPMVGWRVDGVPVPIHVWRFAGGWTAFTDAAAGVYLSVVGAGPGPDDLSLAALDDGRAYHFDPHGSLSLELAKASAEAAGVPPGSPDFWRSQDWHPDQLQLMRDLGQDSCTRSQFRSQPADPRRRGAGGTLLPASARSRGMTTSSPDPLRTEKDSASAASRIPRTSASSSPASPAGRRQRITTRWPTSLAVSRTSSRYRIGGPAAGGPPLSRPGPA
jgi:hypothetical protein